MKIKRNKIIAIIVVLFFLLLITRCSIDKKNTDPTASLSNADPNIILLKKLIYEDEICDEQWAREVLKLGNKMTLDSNPEYLNQYYLNNNVTDSFIDEYSALGVNTSKFASLFLKKKYKESAKLLETVKKQFIEVEEQSNEIVY